MIGDIIFVLVSFSWVSALIYFAGRIAKLGKEKSFWTYRQNYKTAVAISVTLIIGAFALLIRYLFI